MPAMPKRNHKCFLNCVFIGAFALVELFVIGVFIYLFVQTLMKKEDFYTFLSLGIILLWFGIVVGYLAWAVYFYNINMGLTNQDWDDIAKEKENRFLGVCDVQSAKEPNKNPYIDQTFGLPSGTVRGVIALTLLFCAVGMLVFSMSPTGEADNQFIQDNFEFFKTAFLMMVAFYFGSRSLEFLSKRWKSPSEVVDNDTLADVITVSSSDDNVTTVLSDKNNYSSVSPSVIKTNLNHAIDVIEVNQASLKEHELTEDFPHLRDVDGLSKYLDDQEIREIATNYNLEVAAIRAVIKVETNGSGFLSDGRPKILFEGHIFWSQLKKYGIKPEDYIAKFPDIVYPNWTKQHYKGGAGEYERLEKAKLIHEEAALSSASWGLFQIMGFNYTPAGFDNVKSYVEAQYESEKEHLLAFIKFINYKFPNQSKATIEFLREKDWKSFANRYNGPRSSENQYDRKLQIAYNRFIEVNV